MSSKLHHLFIFFSCNYFWIRCWLVSRECQTRHSLRTNPLRSIKDHCPGAPRWPRFDSWSWTSSRQRALQQFDEGGLKKKPKGFDWPKKKKRVKSWENLSLAALLQGRRIHCLTILWGVLGKRSHFNTATAATGFALFVTHRKRIVLVCGRTPFRLKNFLHPPSHSHVASVFPRERWIQL